MKNLVLAAGIFSCVASGAFAGVLSFTPEVEPILVADEVTSDWSGLYLGGKYINAFEGAQTYYFNDVRDPFDRPMAGEMFGGFIGYNIQKDDTVYGVELAYAVGDINRSDGGGRPDNTHTYLADAKLRVGHSFGRTLVFATVGLAASNWQENVRGDVGTAGYSYGAGIDYKIWKDLFVGAEYVHRDLTSGAFPWSSSDEYFTSSLDSIELRLGWNF